MQSKCNYLSILTLRGLGESFKDHGGIMFISLHQNNILIQISRPSAP